MENRPALTARIVTDGLTLGALREFLAWVTGQGANDESDVWLLTENEVSGVMEHSLGVLEVDV